MRYTDKQKADVIAFVKKHNAEHGRGGQSAAKEKFGISPISIANWLSDAGEKLPGKGGRKKKGKAGRPKGSKNTARKRGAGRSKRKTSAAKPAKAAKAAGSGTEKKLKRLSQIIAEIESLQQEFDSLKKTL